MITNLEQENHWIEASILRVGRWACKLVGGLAIVALVVGGLGLGAAAIYWAAGEPSKPAPIPEPAPPPQVSLEDAKRLANSQNGFSDTSSDDFPGAPRKIVQAGEVLRPLFPDAQYTWDDVYQEYCRTPTSYGCLERGRRVSRHGVGRYLAFVLNELDENDLSESVTELQRLLKDAPAPDRASLIIPVLLAERDRSAVIKRAQQEHEQKVDRANAAYQHQLSSYHETAGALAMGGAGAVLYGILTMLSICLVVAILAIERHLRAAASRADPESVLPLEPAAPIALVEPKVG